MNKVFWFLVVMCFVAAGVLWWLLRMSPPTDAKHFAENKIEVIEKDKHDKHSTEVENTMVDSENATESKDTSPEEAPHQETVHEEKPHEEKAVATHKVESPKHNEAKPESKVAKEGPEAAPEIAVDMIVGKKGPVFLQLGSVPLEEWLRGNLDLNAYQGAVACKVDIPGKGLNVRILMGPFDNKKLALKAKAEKTSIPSDSFVTGEQKCLK